MRRFRISRLFSAASPPSRQAEPTLAPQMPREMRIVVVHPSRPTPQPEETVLRGPCRVVDGDTIVIGKRPIRLAGIDAPELDHPWGQKAKWALVALCRGQTVTARIKPEMSYDRVVAECFLPDGRDLAAEMVRAGLALDWPKFSGGKYRHLEQPDARRKLWRAQLRQRGALHPQNADIWAPVPRRNPAAPGRLPPAVAYAPAPGRARSQKAGRGPGWLLASGLLVLVLVCLFIAGNTGRNAPSLATRNAPAMASFVVTADALNVREGPSAHSGIVGQLGRGATIMPERMSGSWYNIVLGNGSTGWVHGDYLRRVGE